MPIGAELPDDLAALADALDDSGSGFTARLHGLAADAQSAVPSYLGLTIVLTAREPSVDVTVLLAGVRPGDVRTSVLIPLSAASAGLAPGTAVILYAGQRGAFVDLAADLAWLTGRELGEFVLDRHVVVPAGPQGAVSVRNTSLIDQAVGMLIGCGWTPESAGRELDARAAGAGIDRHVAADLILTGVCPVEVDPATDPGTGGEPGVDA